jgi:hypothetical protein
MLADPKLGHPSQNMLVGERLRSAIRAIPQGEKDHSASLTATIIGAFSASYRILDLMLFASSPQTAAAVCSGARMKGRGF